MLVFTRRIGESFVLYPSPELDTNMTVAELFAAGPIEISVVEMRPHQIRVGVDAPPEMLVFRSELLPLVCCPPAKTRNADEVRQPQIVY